MVFGILIAKMAEQKHPTEEPTIVTGGNSSSAKFKPTKKKLLVTTLAAAVLFMVGVAMFLLSNNSGQPDDIVDNGQPLTSEAVNSIKQNDAKAALENSSKSIKPGTATVTTSDGRKLPAPAAIGYDEAIVLAGGLATNKADIDLAIEYYKQAMIVAPTSAETVNVSIALTLEQNGRAPESKPYYAAALKLTTDQQTREWLKGKIAG